MPIGREVFENLPKVYVHKSYVQTYIMCPYKLKKMIERGTEGVGSYEQEVGKAFHAFAKEFFEMIDVEKAARYAEPYEYFRTFVPQKTIPQLKMYCERFANFESIRLKYLRDVKKIKDLKKYYLPVATEIKLKNDALGIEGTIDRIDFFDVDGRLILLEYKTSKRFDYVVLRRELAIYAMLAYPTFGMISHIGCFNPAIDEWWVDELNKRTLQNARHWLEVVRDALIRDNLPKRPGFHCGFCEFYVECSPEEVSIDESQDVPGEDDRNS